MVTVFLTNQISSLKLLHQTVTRSQHEPSSMGSQHEPSGMGDCLPVESSTEYTSDIRL